MYKHKYYKYKKKYLELQKKGGQQKSLHDGTFIVSNTNDIGSNMETEEEFVQDDMISESETEHDNHPYMTIGKDPDINIYDEKRDDLADPPGSDNDYVSKFGPTDSLVRGKLLNEYEIDEDDIIHLDDKYLPNKILKLDTLDDFDNFTELYGYVINFSEGAKSYRPVDYMVGIYWNKVMDKYKGVFINKGLEESRKDELIYKGVSYPSWWANDFQFDNIVEFIKE